MFIRCHVHCRCLFLLLPSWSGYRQERWRFFHTSTRWKVSHTHIHYLASLLNIDLVVVALPSYIPSVYTCSDCYCFYWSPITLVGREDGGFKIGRSYFNEDFLVPLPEGVDACDIGTFTIWCEPFTVFFAVFSFPTERIFVSEAWGSLRGFKACIELYFYNRVISSPVYKRLSYLWKLLSSST